MVDHNIKINLKENIYYKNISPSIIGGKKSDYDINIDLISYIESDTYETNNLRLKFSGSDMNHVIMNTLKRVILSLIPIYSFAPNNIQFTSNTSVYNNDYMRLRLSNFPLYISKKLKLELNKYDTLKEARILEYRANLGSKEIDETSLLDLKFDRNELQMVVNIKNNSTTDIMNVDTLTPGVKFILNNKQIEHPYDKPLLIVMLQPEQTINVVCKSDLNIGLKSAIYRCCSECNYIQHSETEYEFILYSRRQILEKDILIRACDIIIEKILLSLNIIIKSIKENSKTSELEDVIDNTLEGTLDIDGEFHTLGNLLVRYMQDHRKIDYAGYSIGHPSISSLKIKYICNEKIIKILNDIQKEIISVFTEIKHQIEELKI